MINISITLDNFPLDFLKYIQNGLLLAVQKHVSAIHLGHLIVYYMLLLLFSHTSVTIHHFLSVPLLPSLNETGLLSSTGILNLGVIGLNSPSS